MITDKQVKGLTLTFGILGALTTIVGLTAGLLIDPVAQLLNITDPTDFLELRNSFAVVAGVGAGTLIMMMLLLTVNDENRRRAEKEELDKKLSELENKVAELKGANDDR